MTHHGPNSRECRLCHRIGSRDFVPVGAEGWECGNDRACMVRKARRDRRNGEDRWNTAVDVLLNSRFTGEPGCQGPFWDYVDEKITEAQLREALM